MLNRVTQRLKAAIIAVTNKESNLATDLLSAEDWRTLNYIRDFLQAFHDATKATKGHTATLKRVLPTMDFLVKHFEKAIKKFARHNFIRESLQAGLTKLLKY